MAVVHGAILYLIADGKRVAKANNISIDQAMQVDTSNPIGNYHHEEIFYTGVDTVQVSFEIEREVGKGLVSRGLWPDTTNDLNIRNFRPLTLEIQDKASGETLHRIKDFLPNRKPENIVKGQKTVYRCSGLGLRETEEDS